MIRTASEGSTAPPTYAGATRAPGRAGHMDLYAPANSVSRKHCNSAATRLGMAVSAVALAALVFALAGQSAAPRTLTAANPIATYPDATGDSATAPDLTQVVITDNGDGTLGVEASLASVQDLADASFAFLIDADNNASTGSAMGSDYVVYGNQTGVALLRWNGSDWEAATESVPLDPNLEAGKLSFRLALADIGGASSFRFGTDTIHGDDIDGIPEDGLYAYPARPEIARILLPFTSLSPVAGKIYRATGAQVILAEDSPQAEITVTCKLTYKGKPLATVGKCAWRLPKTLKGKSVVLTLTYSTGTAVLMSRKYPLKAS
jgi:hypothetical protein